MSVFASLTTGVSGLNAQSKAMGHISDNLANARTAGFKRVETSFSEIVTSARQGQHNPGAVIANARYTHAQQGDLQQTRDPLNMAVTGDGYFMVAEEKTRIDNQPVFEEVNRYTRRGDFKLDSRGYLVNGGGYYLQGLPVDQQTGNPTTAIPQALQISNEYNPAQATNLVAYNANLPENVAVPATTDVTADFAGVASSNVLSDTITSDTGASPRIAPETFVENSSGGGAMTLYDAVGAKIDMQVRWVKLSNGTSPNPAPQVSNPTDMSAVEGVVSGGTDNDVWGAYYYDPDTTGNGGPDEWKFLTAAEFRPDTGVLVSAAQPTITGETLSGKPVPEFTFDFTNKGQPALTQFADTNSSVSVSKIQQNGYPRGELAEVFTDEQGMISATFSNGNTLPIAKVPLVAFSAPDSMERLDGGAFIETPASGAPLLNASGSIVGGAIENSNVDVAEEFTKMIVAQRVYSANAKSITTADEMLREVMGIKR
jgi:flagellar hook protein FlgE